MCYYVLIVIVMINIKNFTNFVTFVWYYYKLKFSEVFEKNLIKRIMSKNNKCENRNN